MLPKGIGKSNIFPYFLATFFENVAYSGKQGSILVYTKMLVSKNHLNEFKVFGQSCNIISDFVQFTEIYFISKWAVLCFNKLTLFINLLWNEFLNLSESKDVWTFTSWNAGTWKFQDTTNGSSRIPNFKKTNGNSIIELISTPTKITGVHYIHVRCWSILYS